MLIRHFSFCFTKNLQFHLNLQLQTTIFYKEEIFSYFLCNFPFYYQTQNNYTLKNSMHKCQQTHLNSKLQLTFNITVINQQTFQYMIPGRILYQSIVYKPEKAPKLKVSLILNSIFYDQIRPFQTKYLCLTSTDFLSIDIQLQDTEQLVGQIKLSNPYKAMVQHQTIDIYVNPPKQSKLKQAKISLVIQPVSSFARHKLGLSTKQPISFNFTNTLTNNSGRTMQNNQTSFDQKYPLQMSFSQRDPLAETSRINQNQVSSPNRRQEKQKLQYSGNLSENQALQSLAHQREKILGQLFDKFKRVK